MPRIYKLVVVLLALAGAVWFLTRGCHSGAGEPLQDAVVPPSALPSRAQPSPGTPGVPAPAKTPEDPPRAEVSTNATPANGPARVRVVLVDERTRAPVPHLVAELRSSDATLERMESDDDGRLTSKASFPPGTYRLDLSSERAANDLIQTGKKADANAFPVDVEIKLAAGPESADRPVLAVPVGPTFQFVAGWPPGLAAERFTAQLSCADPRQAFDKLFARVRPGAPPWARFSPLARFLSGGPPWGVRVTSEDGLWVANATVETLDQSALRPIALEFTARGRIVGRLFDPDQAPIARTWVQAWLPDSSFKNPAKRPVLVLTDQDGRFDLRALEPGAYTLKVEADGFDPLAEKIEVPALTRVEHDVHARRPDPTSLGSIRGHLTSRSRTYAGRVRVSLRPDFPPYAARNLDVEWKEVGGAKEAKFEFKDLVPGTYGITVDAKDLVQVDPREQNLQPSNEVHEITIDDSGARVTIPIRVVGDEDGAPLRGFNVVASVRGSRGARAVASAAREGIEAALAGAPVGATLDLVVHAGRERQIGWQSMVVTSPPEPLVLRLKQGFGTEVTAQGPAREPLSGARIYFDDVLAGTTDDLGVLRVALATTPSVCRVEYRDWVLDSSGDILPDTGRFRTEMPFLRVRMKPRN